eukprot:3180748-Pleurochrysis_carterae.AAC.2
MARRAVAQPRRSAARHVRPAEEGRQHRALRVHAPYGAARAAARPRVAVAQQRAERRRARVGFDQRVRDRGAHRNIRGNVGAQMLLAAHDNVLARDDADDLTRKLRSERSQSCS